MNEMAAMRWREKMYREQKCTKKWTERYGPGLGLDENGDRPEEKHRTPTLQEASVAIVIVGGTLSKGQEPADMLVIRMERGIAEWWNSQTNSLIITTGGESADIMRKMLLDHGCPEQAVYTESEGRSTIEQAHNVAKLLQGSNIKIIKLVTSEFHGIRAKRCFAKTFDGYISDICVSSGLKPPAMAAAVQKEMNLLEEYQRRGWI